MAKRNFQAEFIGIAIGEAARDDRLYDARRLLSFQLEEPDWIEVVNLHARVAADYGLDVDGMQLAIERYEQNAAEGYE